MLSCSSQYANSSILNYPSSDAVIGNGGRVSGLYLRRFGSRIVQVYDYEMCRVFAIKSARYDTPISIVSYKFEAISRARNLGLVPRCQGLHRNSTFQGWNPIDPAPRLKELR